MEGSVTVRVEAGAAAAVFSLPAGTSARGAGNLRVRCFALQTTPRTGVGCKCVEMRPTVNEESTSCDVRGGNEGNSEMDCWAEVAQLRLAVWVTAASHRAALHGLWARGVGAARQQMSCLEGSVE